MFRLKLTNNLASQRLFQLPEQKALFSLCALGCLAALLLGYSFSANASTDQLNYGSLKSDQADLKDTASSHYFSSQMRLIQYSTIFINKTGKQAVKLPNRKLSPQIEDYNQPINLLVSTNDFLAPGATINLLNLDPSHGYSQEATDSYLSGGSALGAVLRMSLKSWWKNNEGSQLHAMSKSAPESMRTGKLIGKAVFDWDYSVKFSYDDVKLKFERDF